LQLDIILRGQSNAAYLAELDGGAAGRVLTQQVEQLLGFDGISDRVRLVYDRDEQGGDTVYPGTSFLGEWMVPNGSGGWQAGRYESEFLGRLGQYRAEGMGDATAVVWMHSEFDSRDPNLSTADWVSAVRTDAALVRQTLGRDVPYLFVAAHPYGDGTDGGHQAIRAGMERLVADPGFDGRIAARAPDLDVSLDDLDGNPSTAEFGAAHINAYDARLIAARVARNVAEEFAGYAKPGSAVAIAGGNIASDGPRVVAATPLDGGRLQVDVAHDGTSGFVELNDVASRGVGWTALLADGRRIEATGAAVLDADSLVVTFGQAVPNGAVLDYAWGIGRIADPGGPGLGNAVMDPTYLSVWTPAQGVAVGGTLLAAFAPVAAPAAAPVAAPVADPVAAPAAIAAATPAAPVAAVEAPAAAPAAAPTPSAADPEVVLATGLVRLAFGRAGTADEVGFLQSLLEAGIPAGTVARDMAEGEAFTTRLAGLDPAGQIVQLHWDALGREPDQAELGEWLGYFAEGATAASLAEGLATWWEFPVVAEARAPGDAASWG
jgi:hypothetical protein